jgi:hypothetical protein
MKDIYLLIFYVVIGPVRIHFVSVKVLSLVSESLTGIPIGNIV